MHEETQRKLRVAGCVRMVCNRDSQNATLQPATLQLASFPHTTFTLEGNCLCIPTKKPRRTKICKKIFRNS